MQVVHGARCGQSTVRKRFVVVTLKDATAAARAGETPGSPQAASATNRAKCVQERQRRRTGGAGRTLGPGDRLLSVMQCSLGMDRKCKSTVWPVSVSQASQGRRGVSVVRFEWRRTLRE